MVRNRITGLLVLISALLAACDRGSGPESAHSTVTLMPPGGQTKVIDFVTDEGTGMSVDVSPDGKWIVFDLLGHVYRVPITGGEAIALTQNSGPALNFHPAISPDGSKIAFTSDRNGQLNIWTMNADGSKPTLVFGDPGTRFTEPAWAPDGKSIVAVRAFRTPGRSWHRQTRTLAQLPLDGGQVVSLIEERLMHPDAPSFSPDGKQLYYHVSYSIGEGLGMLTAGHRIQRREMATGALANVRTTESAELTAEFRQALRGGGYATDVGDEPAAISPRVSPNGKLLAFAREMPGETFTWRGHAMRPKTALWVRDLATGAERVVLPEATKDLTQTNAQYAYRVFPAFGWMPDASAIVLTVGGKIQRLDVASGALQPIPFTARVLRTVAEPVRGRIRIDDDSLEVRFIQWPASSPDGKRLAFVAVGRVWVMDLPNGTPRPLTESMLPAFQLTPAWSPDGSTIAFTTWDDRTRGALWTVPARGGAPRRLTTEPGEYLGPVWSPDGASIAVTRGAGPGPRSWNPWDQAAGWTLVRVSAGGGPPRVIAGVGAWGLAGIGPDGRLTFANQDSPASFSPLLYKPFPDSAALANVVRVRSVDWEGQDIREHAEFPARRGKGNTPLLSPDGKWVAYDAAHEMYAAPLDGGAGSTKVDPNPNHPAEGRVRIGTWGGIYPRWRNATTLEFASGRRYLTYDFPSKTVNAVEIHLKVPRMKPAGTIALVGAKIITIDSQQVIDRGTVVVRGARIDCVGTCDTTGVSRVVDVSGRTIMPGLIDLHAHHTSDESGVIAQHRSESALDLAYGVTTIVDPATISESAFPLAELIEAGLVTGPRTWSSAEFVITPGIAWGDYHEIDSLDEARIHVNKRADWGAVTIKNYRQPGRHQHQLLVAAARERGISLTSEGGPLFLDVGYAIDGQSGWEHFIADLPIYKDAATFFGKAGLVYSPTVIVAGVPHGAMEYFRPRQGLLEDVKGRRFMPYSILEAKVRSARATEIEDMAFPILAEGVADIVRAGGYAAIGEHGEQVGIGSHWELWAYATGLTPVEAIKIATYDGAYFVGAHQELGSIRRGKVADLVILEADPTVDIRNSAKVAMVMKAGRLYDAGTLDEIWPEQKPYGVIPWSMGPVR